MWTYSLAGGDLEDLGGETDGALDTELLVLGTVDEVRRDYRCPVVSTGVYCVKWSEKRAYTSRGS